MGAKPSEKFAKVRHAVPMLSLDNAFDDEEVQDFVAKVRRFLNLGDSPLSFTAEPKIDGLSLSLRYEDGKLVTAATRGDGSEGEDVTANARTVQDIPREIPQKGIVEIRGEIYLSHADFAAIKRAPGGGRQAGLRQSAQRGGGLAATARFAHHGAAPAQILRLCLGGDGRATGEKRSSRWVKAFRIMGLCHPTRT